MELLVHGIIFSLALYLIQNLVGNLELIKFSSFYKQTISVRSTRVLDEGNAQYSLYLAEFYINNSQKLRIN